MNAEQLLNYKLPTWSFSPTHFQPTARIWKAETQLCLILIKDILFSLLSSKGSCAYSDLQSKISVVEKNKTVKKLWIFSNMRGLYQVIRKLQIRFPEFFWDIFTGKSLKLLFMIATSAFGKIWKRISHFNHSRNSCWAKFFPRGRCMQK